MKIAICLGNFSVGRRPLDFHFNNIYDSARGLTGTDLAFCEISKALALRGHYVSMFTVHAQPHHKPNVWGGAKLYNYYDAPSIIDDSFDVILSINEPDTFRNLTQKPLRLCWQFLNDFVYCIPGFEEYVDQWLGVCDAQVNHLKGQTHSNLNWKLLNLGCDVSLYSDRRVPGRVVWTSSADRGLHWLLQEWPEIKKAVPHASLKVFYHFNYPDDLLKVEPQGSEGHTTIELAQRVRYMKQMLPKLRCLDVEHVGSVSRFRMANELSEASVFAFSCDTVCFTEGFSLSTLEAHASYTVPVITDKDCLGTVYKDSGCIVVPGPLNKTVKEFRGAVVQALTDKSLADSVVNKCREFASSYSWPNIVEKLEIIIAQHPKFKKD